ncbi:MAG: TlpA family protein disulfide reductase [Deltaproteobacteria bacterium]|nr:TlpA family protein disulfide reductase [Deltaproteobacteria bacterium]
MPRLRSLGPSLALVLLAGAVPACATGSAAGGGAAPAGGLDLSLPDVDGELITPTAETGQEVFLLAFWATWCQPCQQELSKMNTMYSTRKARGLRVFAINIDGPDTAAQVGPWVEREGYTFPVLLDRETQVLTRYNPRGDLPYYVVLDAQGRVMMDHQGYMTGDMEELESYLDSVLPAG